MIVSDAIGEKALRLVDEKRVHLEGNSLATVAGDGGFHRVCARSDSVWCDCPAWKPDRLCSHCVACMILWKEHADYAETEWRSHVVEC